MRCDRITTTKYARNKCGKCRYCRKGAWGTRRILRPARAAPRPIPWTIIAKITTAPLIRPESVRQCTPSAAATVTTPIKRQRTFQVLYRLLPIYYYHTVRYTKTYGKFVYIVLFCHITTAMWSIQKNYHNVSHITKRSCIKRIYFGHSCVRFFVFDTFRACFNISKKIQVPIRF